MRADIVLGAVMLAMAILGGIVSAHAPVKLRHKVAYGTSFLILGIVGFYFVVRQSNETAVATTDLAASIKELGESSKENTRIQHLNTELQERLLTQGKTIGELARAGIKTVTGGNSFCLMNFWDNENLLTADYGTPFFESVGSYPLYDVRADVTDQRKFHAILAHSKGPDSLASETATARITFNLGNLPVATETSPGQRIVFTDSPLTQRFLVQFIARNGSWIQQIRLARVKNRWVKAFRVTTGNKWQTVMYECIDDAFPKAEVDWKPSKNACAGKSVTQ